MDLKNKITEFINHPFPLWENELTSDLSICKMEELEEEYRAEKYSTGRVFLRAEIPIEKRQIISSDPTGKNIYLEAKSSYLEEFYREHGLTIYSEKDLHNIGGIQKVKSALKILNLVPALKCCIVQLVGAIQVIKQDDMEMDVSYSHPKIPFSIFVSVCEQFNIVSDLRVSESILHEAMHLKLSLIEHFCPLVKDNAKNLFYSPWRDEPRPAQGILHGLFVFTAILKFVELIENVFADTKVRNYLDERKYQILSEINKLRDFENCPDLTEAGAKLTRNLLPLN